MAKRRTSGRTAKATRTPKAKSKKAAPTTEVEVVEEAAGEGIDTGIVVMTTLTLVAAILFLDKLLGSFGEPYGVFF
jgi:hypothetical protein